jgi:hypothetical protein
MQSEFACHIGMRGKLFCRACWVKGSDALDVEDPFINPENNGNSDAESQASEFSAGASEEDLGGAQSSVPAVVQVVEEVLNPNRPSSSVPKKKKRGKLKESMSAMINRVMSFIKVPFHWFFNLKT